MTIADLQGAAAWSVEEEQIIAAIQQTESVSRAEAIRRMRRRGLDDLRGRIRSLSCYRTKFCG